MSKKSKKAKNPKVKGGGKAGKGGGNDPITGIALDIQGVGRIQSDTVYDSSSEQASRLKSLLGSGITDEILLELEYSSNAIVLNTITRRRGAETGIGGAGDYYNRNIFFGRFLPPNGKERDFLVDSYYRGGFYPWDTWDDASQQRISTTYEHVTKFEGVEGANLILSTNLLKTYQNTFGNSGVRGRIFFSTEPSIDSDEGWTSSNSRGAIPREVSDLFLVGWHNPSVFFSSNLI